MRILLLNYEFPPLGGGASAASYQLARTLVAKGHRVDVVTSRMPGQLEREDFEGIHVIRVATRRKDVQDCGLLGAATYVLAASAATYRLTRQHSYDVVHYFFGLPTGALALAVPKLRQIPSVLSLRGSDVPGYDDSQGVLPALHGLLHPVTRAIWSSVDRIVANSDGLRHLAQQFLPDVPIGMIPNAVRTDIFKPSGTCHYKVAAPVRILCVARLVARKGIADLLDALALIPHTNVRLSLQGSGRDEAALRRRADRLGIATRVDFCGFKPQSELAPSYADADIFVLPSHSESCSMALLEAMSSGLPVIATRVGGTPELVEEGLGGILLPERSPKSLAAALMRLIRSPEDRARMGTHNRKRIECLSWDSVSAAYLAEYEHVIEMHRKEPSRLSAGTPL